MLLRPITLLDTSRTDLWGLMPGCGGPGDKPDAKTAPVAGQPIEASSEVIAALLRSA